MHNGQIARDAIWSIRHVRAREVRPLTALTLESETLIDSSVEILIRDCLRVNRADLTLKIRLLCAFLSKTRVDFVYVHSPAATSSQ